MLEASVKEIKLFYCYAREDKDLRDELEIHLSGLRRQYRLTNLSDREILPGELWEQAIDTHLETADVILLLISPDFIASDYCYNKEMERALQRQQERKCCVIPILLRPIFWEGTPLSSIQMLPTGGKAITSWYNRDEAFHDVVTSISRTIEALVNSNVTTETQQANKKSYQPAYRDREERARITLFKETPWKPNFSLPNYINVPRILQILAIQDALIDGEMDFLKDLRSLRDIRFLASVLVIFQRFLKNWRPDSIDLESPHTLQRENIGACINFNTAFRTKNVPWRDEVVSFAPKENEEPHIYCKVGKKKVILNIDPRWITGDSAFLSFRSGNCIFSGIGILNHVDAELARITPLERCTKRLNYGKLHA